MDEPSPRHARRHRALAHPVRLRILELLRDGPQDAGTLAADLGLHPNTVRSHLAKLERGGLVTRHRSAPAGPGRPKMLFARTGRRVDPSAGELEGLVGVLAASLASATDDPERAAEAAGIPWGESLAAGTTTAADEREAVAELAALLGELGFDPEVLIDDPAGTATVLLHRCPFADVVRRHGEVICAAHRGLIAGALAELGADASLVRLEPYVRPEMCLAELALGR